MKASKIAKKHGQYALEYDSLVEKFEAHNADIMFGLLFDTIQKNEKLLALAIGTGLCAAPFKRYGLKISGVDISEEMMKMCRTKGITEELRILDLRNDNFPFETESFDHVIANGVFHFIEDLDLIFKETCRVLKPGGAFGFSTMDPGNIDKKYNKLVDEESGIDGFEHSHKYISELVKTHGFELKKRARMLMYKNLEKTEENTAGMYVVIKAGRK